MKKIYTSEEVLTDITRCLGMDIQIPNIENYLFLSLYSQINHEIEHTSNHEEIYLNINDFLENNTIPLIDYSDHVNKDLVILDISDSTNPKTFTSFNYSENLLKKYKQIKIIDDLELEDFHKFYNEEIIKQVFKLVSYDDNISIILVIDFVTKTIIFLKKSLN